jgi:outer membrane protein assembly factor BamB
MCRYDRLPFTDGIVNFVFVDRLGELLKQGLSLREVLRVLCPGGVALIGDAWASEPDEQEFAGAIEKVGIVDYNVIRQHGRWLRIVKPRLTATDEWTHFEYDAARTSASNDRLVGPPTRLQWLTGSHWPNFEFGHRPDVGFASAEGRNFYWYTDASRPTHSLLECRDAFNGLVLWSREIDRTARATLLIATGDRVYVHLGGPGGLAALDAVTGQELLRYQNSRDDSRAEVFHSDDIIVEYAAHGIRAHHASEGTLLWERPSEFKGIDTLVIGEAKVFLLHRDSEGSLLHLMSCDLKTGNEIWRRNVQSLKHQDSVSLICYRRGTLLLGSSSRSHYMKGDLASATYAVSAMDGKLLWTHEYDATHHFGRATNVLFLDNHVWVKQAGEPRGQKATHAWVALDPGTGEEVRRYAAPYNRCYPDRASGDYILTGDFDFLDPRTGTIKGSKAARGSCNTAFMPANGMTYSFYTGCNCFNFLRGLMAFSSDPSLNGTSANAEPRLERGPAFGFPVRATNAPDDWPTLRHDASRTGGTTTSVPVNLRVLWTTQLNAHVSSPTVAGGRVFVAVTNEHRVVALDAETGREQWSYQAGGPIDSPPTIHRGLALFGSADGWVYSVRAHDGKLVWRLQAAPGDRRIVVRDQLESSWPVHGSILVQENTAYFAAGRHTQLDGGIWYYAVEPATAKLLFRRRAGDEMRDSRCDVLVSDGHMVHLGQRVHFDPHTGLVERGGSDRPVLFALNGLLTDNTTPGANSHGMTFHVRPWAYRKVKTNAEPRGVSWEYPLKGNLLVVRGESVFGILEQWRNVPRPRHRQWGVFGKPSANVEKWVRPAEYAKKPEAMTLAGERLYIARRGADGVSGEVLILSANDGRELGQVILPAAPRWDGLAAACGQLYVSMQSGEISCLAEAPPGKR